MVHGLAHIRIRAGLVGCVTNSIKHLKNICTKLWGWLSLVPRLYRAIKPWNELGMAKVCGWC